MEKFNEFLASFKIEDTRKYTTNEVAAIMRTTPRNVKFWRECGLRSKRSGTIVLESFMCGGVPMILGIHLKHFIMERNGIKTDKPA